MAEPVISLCRSLTIGARTAHVPPQFKVSARAARRAAFAFAHHVCGCRAHRQTGAQPGGSSAAGQAGTAGQFARRQSASNAELVGGRSGGAAGAARSAGHRFPAPTAGAAAGAGVEVHPVAPGAGQDVPTTGPAGGSHHRLACRGHPSLDRPAGRAAMNALPITRSRSAEIFITSPSVLAGTGRTLVGLRWCIGLVVTARQPAPPQRLLQPGGCAPGPLEDQKGCRSRAEGAGGGTLHRGGEARRRMPAVLVGRFVRQAVIGFPGEVRHG